jgi:hypothetical protein
LAPDHYVPENKLWKHVSTVEADNVLELQHCDLYCTDLLQAVPLAATRHPAIHEVFKHSKYPVGRAVAQAVSRRDSTAAASIRAQVSSRGICGG